MAIRYSAPISRRSAGLGLGGVLLSGAAAAQPAPPPPFLPPPATPAPPAAATPVVLPLSVRSGQDVFTLMGSTLFGTYTQIANDITRVMDDYLPAGPRILPVVAGGGMQVLYDLLRLDAFTGAILSAIVLDVVRRGNWLPDLTQKLSYVSHLYFEETHIISSQLFPDATALNGKVVNLGPVGGGTDVIARRMFELLGITPIFDNRPTMVALKDIPSGTVAAAVFIAGKPVPLFREFGVVGNLRLIPIRWNADVRARLDGQFRPAVLLHGDYPKFIPEGTQVETVSSAVFLMMMSDSRSAQRQQALSLLLTELVKNLITLQQGADQGIYHPKWREVSVLERLPGFRRAPALLNWINREDAANP